MRASGIYRTPPWSATSDSRRPHQAAIPQAADFSQQSSYDRAAGTHRHLLTNWCPGWQPGHLRKFRYAARTSSTAYYSLIPHSGGIRELFERPIAGQPAIEHVLLCLGTSLSKMPRPRLQSTELISVEIPRSALSKRGKLCPSVRSCALFRTADKRRTMTSNAPITQTRTLNIVLPELTLPSQRISPRLILEFRK